MTETLLVASTSFQRPARSGSTPSDPSIRSHGGGGGASAPTSSRELGLGASSNNSNSSSSNSLVAKAKRKLSRGVVPKFLHSSSAPKAIDSESHPNPEDGSTAELGDFGSAPPTPTKAYTIAPHHHRENTALHALIDSISLPTLPTFSTPHLPSFRKASTFADAPASLLACIQNPESALMDEPEGWNREAVYESTTPTNEAIGKAHDDPLRRLKGDVLVLGGYRGSILRDAKTNRRLWVPLKVGMGWRKPDLYIGLDDEDELRSTETIVPGKMLMQVGFINLGKRLKDKLKSLEATSKNAELRFHNHGYDWRRNLDLSSAELLDKLERLKADSAAREEGVEGKGEGTTVICHSMGGLVTLHALARASDPTVFKQIIFAGTPFHGCVNALSPLRVGDGVMLNRDICSPEACFSMRSTFYFLPRDGRCFETPEGAPLHVDFSDPVSFAKYNLSPLMANLYDAGGPDHEAKRLQARAEALKADEIGVAPAMKMNLGDSEKVPIPKDENEGEVALDFEGSRTPPSGSPSSSRRGSATEEATATAAGAMSVPMSPTSSMSSEDSYLGGTKSEAGAPLERRKGDGTASPEQRLSRVMTSDAEISDYLVRTLNRVRKFYDDLETLYDPAKAHLYPKVALLTSRKTATVRGVVTDSFDHIREPYERLLWDAGDGIVLYESASRMPGKWNTLVTGVIESGNGHVSLLTDLDAVRKCLEVLEK